MRFLYSLKRVTNLHRVLLYLLHRSIFSASRRDLFQSSVITFCALTCAKYWHVSVELELICLAELASRRRCIRGCKLTGDEVIRFDRSILRAPYYD